MWFTSDTGVSLLGDIWGWGIRSVQKFSTGFLDHPSSGSTDVESSRQGGGQSLWKKLLCACRLTSTANFGAKVSGHVAACQQITLGWLLVHSFGNGAAIFAICLKHKRFENIWISVKVLGRLSQRRKMEDQTHFKHFYPIGSSNISTTLCRLHRTDVCIDDKYIYVCVCASGVYIRV